METLNPIDYHHAHAHNLSRSQTSHLGEPRLSSPAVQSPLSATRIAPPADMQLHDQSVLSAPASQESIASARSVPSSASFALHGSNSDLSSYATNDTGLTSPSSSAETRTLVTLPDAASQSQRDITPEQAPKGALRQDADDSLASPMSITSPGTQGGAKRTASGHVKNAPSLPSNFFVESLVPRSPRRQSLSSPNTKAGELAQSLRSRLEYAMAKVQHGWEHKSIAEVEQLAARKALGHRHSVSNVERPTTSGLSNGTSQLSIFSSPRVNPSQDAYASPPFKRRPGMYGPGASPYLSTSPPLNGLPQLQPAADIRPTSSSGSRHFHTTSTTNTRTAAQYTYSAQPHNHNSMSPPRTPIASMTASRTKVKASPRAHRPPTIRTQTQTAEAERDALQALYELGSPRTSSQLSSTQNVTSANGFSESASNQASPWRGTSQHDIASSAASTPRRIAFARSDSDGDSTENANLKSDYIESGKQDALRAVAAGPEGLA